MIEKQHEYIEAFRRLPGRQDQRLGLGLIAAGHNIGKENYRWGPLIRDFYSVHFIRAGILHVKQGNTLYELRKGDAFCFYPHIEHQYWSEGSSDPIRMFWIAMNGGQAEGLLQDAGITPDQPHVRDVVTPSIEHLHRHILQLIAKNQDGLIYASRILEMFHLIQERRGPYTPQDWIYTGAEYMRLHYNENITVSEVSRYVGVDRSHFTKRFTEEMGASPQSFLQQLKYEKSMELLRSTSLTVSEVAYTIGYSDLHCFSKFFKKISGISPQTYRDQCRKSSK